MQNEATASSSNAVMRYSYSLMFMNLLVLVVSAFVGYQQLLHETGLAMLLVQHPLALVIALIVVTVSFSATAQRAPILAMGIWFGLSILMGFMLAPVAIVYTITSILHVGMMTAVLFLVLTVLSFQTKYDMSRLAGQMTGMLLAVIIVSLINVFFFHSSGVDLVISIISVVIFSVWTMIDTQRLKSVNQSGESNFGAGLQLGFQLYLDFINLFLNLLRIFGQRN